MMSNPACAIVDDVQSCLHSNISLRSAFELANFFAHGSKRWRRADGFAPVPALSLAAVDTATYGARAFDISRGVSAGEMLSACKAGKVAWSVDSPVPGGAQQASRALCRRPAVHASPSSTLMHGGAFNTSR